MLGSGVIKEGNPMAVHFVMFLPTILGQGTTEQQVEWLGRAWSMNILGTYAQTELGKGKPFLILNRKRANNFVFGSIRSRHFHPWIGNNSYL